MRPPNTADERERRFIEYMLTLNKGQLGEVRLRRLNRIANFRKSLMDLVNQMIETRAEDLAAAMLMEHAPERPKREPEKVLQGRLPLRKRRIPKWVAEEKKTARQAARGRGSP